MSNYQHPSSFLPTPTSHLQDNNKKATVLNANKIKCQNENSLWLSINDVIIDVWL